MEGPEVKGGLLVVDDEPFLRGPAASLRFLGFEVTTAQTGTDAPLQRQHQAAGRRLGLSRKS